MKLIKNQNRNAVERGVINQHSAEDAFCQHLDACSCRDTLVEAHAVAYGLAYRLAQHGRHPFSNLPRRQSTRFKHQDFSIFWQPIYMGQALPDGERQQRGFARSGWRRYYQACIGFELAIQLVSNLPSWQRAPVVTQQVVHFHIIDFSANLIRLFYLY